MRISRVYLDAVLTAHQEVRLPLETAHYLLHVLRLKVGESLIVFNGLNWDYHATLIHADKKMAMLQLHEGYFVTNESPLETVLVQALARPEHMDYSLQKATELGVTRIVPVITARSPPVDNARRDKRQGHWLRIVASACEQCGRAYLPRLDELQPLDAGLRSVQTDLSLVLDPSAENYLTDFNEIKVKSVAVLIGAEGGLASEELAMATQMNYKKVRLGTRILRTETASSATLTLCQWLWGDWQPLKRI
ncbi:16S rRNA (uracil(1498)-N(3))-methyltransferase [Thioflexithrix psekupsensis]|uniref:Ribosomal RNA small subunit methyltransferase E n=1 Tax=Thioflexithrix psekupsensis TaxID=1570016 RepID=A0A251X727_9GAMM|nr:16S rRNA (uracil(1498)-N(3))-methyltransferase [Thioflexithrix psekupsensis]OUD12902.1 16S rRNA (uracil(1498)-N(3))-methyltransferase [Thioflexithrix psekupsensis]